MTNWNRKSVYRSISALLVVLAGMGACDKGSTEPDPITVLGRRLGMGELTTCALASDGRMYCWGQNALFMEYGVDSAAIPSSLVPVNTGVDSLVALASGQSSHMCGITKTGSAKCWGRNTGGQLGLGIINTSNVVGTIPTGQWTQLDVSRLSTCGITNLNGASCWGSNSRGEGGNSTRPIPDFASAPRAVEGGRDYKHVAAGWLHGCAIASTGDTYCFGDNNFGQLGNGVADTSARRIPALVQTTVKFTQLAAGANYTCGIATDQSAYCWGQNTMGQLGDGTTTSRAVPTAVLGGLKFTKIAASSGFGAGSNVPPPSQLFGAVAHTCGIAVSGGVYCWGWNGAGQLGDGTFTDRLAPVPVSGGNTYTDIGLGGSHTCAMKGNAVYCWGGNASGQLGIGTRTSVNVPTLVGAPFNVSN